MVAPLHWIHYPNDEVWSQMTDYWQATGQLDQTTIDAWDRSEAGFFQLGTQASSYAGWASDPTSADASGWWSSPLEAGRAVGEQWATGSDTCLAGAWS